MKINESVAAIQPQSLFLIRVNRSFKLHVMISLGVLSLAIPIAYAEVASLSVRFWLLILILLLYAFAQLSLIHQFHPQLWIINPSVQYTFIGHLLPTASILMLMFFSQSLQLSVGFESTITPGYVKYEWLNILGAVALWSGYWSGISARWARLIANSRLLGRLLRPGLKLNLQVVWVLITISIGARLLAIKLGVYGYSSSYYRLMDAAAYTQYLSMAGDLGKVMLIAVSLGRFTRGIGRNWLILSLLCIETGFGVLSGFKSAVVLPTVIVGICYYVKHGKFPRWLLPAILIGILIAYTLIEPFRKVRYSDPGFQGTSLYSIVDSLSYGKKFSGLSVWDVHGIQTTAASFLHRFADVTTAAYGIEYASQIDKLPPGSPNFLRDIFLSPFYALVPRVIWGGKPFSNIGLWYTQIVMGLSHFSSTAMYPVTYLNFAGGAFAVFIGFFGVGVIQSALFRGLMIQGGSAAFLIVCMIGFWGHIDSVFYSFFIALMRYFPMLLLIQWAIFRSEKPSIPL